MQTYEERLRHFIESRRSLEGTINAMVNLQLEVASADERTLVFSFLLEEWEMNPAGHTHGGMLSTMLDIAMGGAAYTFSQAAFTPTIQLSVNFVKSSHASQQLRVEAVCDHVGSRMIQTRAIAYQTSGEIVASAVGSYAVNTKTEKTTV